MPEVIMPRLSDTMKEGVLSRWIKNEGDHVREGDVIAEIDTDKATMDLEAFDEGVLEKQLVAEGTTVPIGEPVAIIGTGTTTGSREAPPPTDAAASTSGAGSRAPGAQAESQAAAASTDRQQPPARQTQEPPAAAPTTRILSSPLARRIAKEHDIDPADIIGTGPGGRIVRADVEAAVTARAQESAPRQSPAAQAAQAGAGDAGGDSLEIPLTTMRKVMAERLAESAGAPHFFLTNVVVVDRLMALRAEINKRFEESGVRVSVTDMLVKACALTLEAHPRVNASWAGDKILQHRRAHIGVAVALEDGLVVPVVRDAATKGLEVIAAETRALAQQARNHTLAPAQFSGGTFTLSNLGMFGIDNFTAVINPPEAAILAVGSTTQEPYVDDGQLLSRHIMKVTLTADHRVLDGAVAAAFLRDLKRTLEEPLRIIL
ncbi:dihydrolipoamide acetyltransferase family protein [Paeniglutamicibacter psychrophenolicus]|uniref:dihydrolipoamide acetyltransferase family protein n=1 Tax=Paeniglutamicibacter psychrophenolicus TaxID=257454 RepID=UPI002786A574|nr:dihydrolipoamide acetyltransferase family protein [Paeniglutamicibacter psychrophenolicus]MDQ0095002.1 pyruvate dehydrogenase E2 component (dihydrolipoamide acetyltransferase) [Paeniglutamicibacter psychrophenolicus]